MCAPDSNGLGHNLGVSQPPADEYRARLERRWATHVRLTRLDLRFSQTRLGVFGLFVLVGILSWMGTVPYWWLWTPIVALGVLIQRHDRGGACARDAAARAMTFLARLARIEIMARHRVTGERYIDEHHLYAMTSICLRGSLFDCCRSHDRARERTRSRPGSRHPRREATSSPEAGRVSELTLGSRISVRQVSIVGTEAARSGATACWLWPSTRAPCRRPGSDGSRWP